MDRDCDDRDGAVFPGAEDLVGDAFDANCDGHGGVDGHGSASLTSGGTDRDDADPSRHPAAAGQRGDELHSDSSGDPDDVDGDGDGQFSADCGGLDCDGGDAARAPGLPEVCGDADDRDEDRSTATSCGSTTARTARRPGWGSSAELSLPGSVTSSGGVLHVEFESDYSVTYDGFEASWAATYTECSAGFTSTDETGFVTDGSGPDADYSSNQECTWLIDLSARGQTVELTFSEFAIESGYDFVTAFDGPDTSYPVLAHSDRLDPAWGAGQLGLDDVHHLRQRLQRDPFGLHGELAGAVGGGAEAARASIV